MIYFCAQTDSTTHTNRVVGDNTYCIEEGMMWERDTRGGKTEDVWMTYSSSSHPWYRSACDTGRRSDTTDTQTLTHTQYYEVSSAIHRICNRHKFEKAKCQSLILKPPVAPPRFSIQNVWFNLHHSCHFTDSPSCIILCLSLLLSALPLFFHHSFL